MTIKSFYFKDEEEKQYVFGYVLDTEEEITVVYEGYGKEVVRHYKDQNEIIKELIQTRKCLEDVKTLLEQETLKNDELEILLNIYQ